MILESIAADAAGIGARAALHLDPTFRRFLAASAAEQTPTFVRAVTGAAHPLGNFAVIGAGADADAAARAARPLSALAVPAALIFPAGLDADRRDAMNALGFVHEAQMPAMAVDIERMAPMSLPSGYEFVRVGTGLDVPDWTEGLATGYELPPEVAALFSPGGIGLDPAPDAAVQFFAVRRDGRTVATSALCLADGLAGIYCVSTLAAERKRGLGAYATAAPLQAAHALGYRVGVLQASEAGYPVYLRMGFGVYARVPMLVRMPG